MSLRPWRGDARPGRELEPAFVEAVTRKPRAMRGQPFLVEVIIAYDCKADLAGVGESYDPVTSVRPPVRQPGAAAVGRRHHQGREGHRAVALRIAPEKSFIRPRGPREHPLHEEAIKFVDEYYEEIRLAIQECGRKISKHIRSIKRGEKAVMGGNRPLAKYAGSSTATPPREKVGPARSTAEAFGFNEIIPRNRRGVRPRRLRHQCG